jgi:hypothetical protein
MTRRDLFVKSVTAAGLSALGVYGTSATKAEAMEDRGVISLSPLALAERVAELGSRPMCVRMPFHILM